MLSRSCILLAVSLVQNLPNNQDAEIFILGYGDDALKFRFTVYSDSAPTYFGAVSSHVLLSRC